jgi:hypothetical protein
MLTDTICKAATSDFDFHQHHELRAAYRVTEILDVKSGCVCHGGVRWVLCSQVDEMKLAQYLSFGVEANLRVVAANGT